MIVPWHPSAIVWRPLVTVLVITHHVTERRRKRYILPLIVARLGNAAAATATDADGGMVICRLMAGSPMVGFHSIHKYAVRAVFIGPQATPGE